MISTTTPESPSIGTVARKRRRQIIQQSRNTKTTASIEEKPSKKRCAGPITSSAPRKVSDAQSSSSPSAVKSTKAKKTQMRYDPEVPMSKEEAAAWRKEQRRKRNRESAAASRQRQRDRITELEQEVSDWKAKYEEALARIERLEQLKESGSANFDADHVCSSPDYPTESAAVSPCPSPKIEPSNPSSQVSMASSSEVMSLREQDLCEEMERPFAIQGMQEQEYYTEHLSEKISRPAVKITGATYDCPVPADPESNSPFPDPCTSAHQRMTHIEDIEPTPLSPISRDEDVELLANEMEFDEFLLDAAEWL